MTSITIERQFSGASLGATRHHLRSHCSVQLNATRHCDSSPEHLIIDATQYGFKTTYRIEMMRLLGLSQSALGARRIDDMFDESFFQTNFWNMWRTTFAFQKWHSAAELKRYFST